MQENHILRQALFQKIGLHPLRDFELHRKNNTNRDRIRNSMSYAMTFLPMCHIEVHEWLEDRGTVLLSYRAARSMMGNCSDTPLEKPCFLIAS